MARVHCSTWSHGHLVQTVIAICLLHTSLRRVRKPTYPDLQASISLGLHRSLKIGIKIPKSRLLWNRGFWGWANDPRWTHANLSIPCLLASPQNLQQQWGGLQSSLKIGIKHCQPTVVKKWGFWGGANRTSSTQARLPRPCFLDQPQLYFRSGAAFK